MSGNGRADRKCGRNRPSEIVSDYPVHAGAAATNAQERWKSMSALTWVLMFGLPLVAIVVILLLARTWTRPVEQPDRSDPLPPEQDS
ncbi:hypothetical protein CLV72_110213 [Allonocardiopsis opalescens]|uniref:Uncharacterized protein n=1 Tax=Allonocardiopsis opalescens TaxID=1144618 RepID=A0A2T0PU85_9ACTN|nr:hypothetical protein CLV72_110213 [Allonocardiopsis opalescens]